MRLRNQLVGSSGIKLLHIAIGLVSSLILARWLGPAGFGQYSYALALAGSLSVFALLGWPTLLSREVARANVRGDWSRLRGALRASNRTILWTSGLAIAVGAGVAWFTHHGGGEQDGLVILMAVAAIPLMAIGDLRAAALRGLDLVFRGQMLDSIVRPGLLTLLVLGAWLLGSGSPRLAMAFQLIAALLTVAAGVFVLHQAVPAQARQAPAIGDPAWRSALLPLAFVSGAQALSIHVPLVLLGLLSTADDTGLYRVAAAISAQVAFSSWPINAIYAPRIVKAHMGGDTATLRGLVGKGRRFGLLIAVPAAAGILLIGAPVLDGLLGPAYRPAYLPMAILAIGQLLSVSAGPIGPVLGLTGNERYVARATLAGLVTSIVLGAWLAPLHGAVGAAIASAAALVCTRTLLWYYARRVILESAPGASP